MRKQTYIVFAILIFITSLGWSFLSPLLLSEASSGETVTAPHPGFKAPVFNLQNGDGDLLTNDDFTGQPTLLFFWTSWCSVCKTVMPQLEDVYRDYAPKGFEILAVNATTQDSAPAAQAEFQSKGYTYPLLYDLNGSAGKAYDVRAFPTAVLIGPDGIIQEVTIGSGLTSGALRAFLDDWLESRGEE